MMKKILRYLAILIMNLALLGGLSGCAYYQPSITVNERHIAILIVCLAAVSIAFVVLLIAFIRALKKGRTLLQQSQHYQKTAENLHVAFDEMRLSNRSKSEFIAKMSHEIRTPMNAIVGMTELVLRENELGEIKEHAITIKQAGLNLISIVNDVLDLSKIKSGKAEILPVSYMAASLFNDVVSNIRMSLLDRQVRFVVNIDCNIPGTLYGDVLKISQVLINVLSNSVKFTDRGFISFDSSYKVIDDETINLIFEISDTGRGIKQKDLAEIFNEFHQLPTNLLDGTEGVGLGLPITKSIIEAMGGQFDIRSEYGAGTAFTIIIPQKYEEGETLASVMNPESINVLLFERRQIHAVSVIRTMEDLEVRHNHVSTTEELIEKLSGDFYSHIFISQFMLRELKSVLTKYIGGTRIVVLTEFGEAVTETISGTDIANLPLPIYCLPAATVLNNAPDVFTYRQNEGMIEFTASAAKVLIVDDLEINVQVAQGLMGQYNMQLDSAEDGLQAMEMLKSKPYDIIFMDHFMPVMDGLEAVRAIRKMGEIDPFYKNIPIVAMTANAFIGMREMYLANGFNDFLPKPIIVAELNEILHRWIPDELIDH